MTLTPIDPGPLPPDPLVSVVMANYNYGAYIRDAIDSVLGQTYRNFELIVVDDGSSDDSVHRVRQCLGDSRIKLVEKENGGQASGFNEAFRRSRGEIICFLDSDDLFLPTKLEHIVECAKRFDDAGCILNGFVRLDGNMRAQGIMPLLSALPSGWMGQRCLQQGGVIPNFPGTPGLNLRRGIAARLFPMPLRPPLNHHPDMVMMRLLPLACRMAAIDEPLASVRLHLSNTYQRTRITSESLRREINVCRELWREQQYFLAGIDRDLPRQLQPLDHAPDILRQKYMLARLGRTEDLPMSFASLMQSLRFPRARVLQLLFWAGTRLLPVNVFATLVNTLYTQNRLKQMVLAVKRFRRNGKSASSPHSYHSDGRIYESAPTA
jgi:glycosyltransferase involved in cell wall biosynthesis